MPDPLPFTWPQRPGSWELLQPGTGVLIVKRNHDGRDVVTYPGIVRPTRAAEPWVEIEAKWTAGTVVQGSLTFETGDILREFFSWQHPFNAFAVYSTQGQLKGWYANVTYPSWVEHQGDVLIVPWQDLWLDVVSDAADCHVVLDEDELLESGLSDRDPDLHAAVVAAKDELLELLASRTGPFVPSDLTSR